MATIHELKKILASKPKPAEAKPKSEDKKTLLTVPYSTPSDEIDVESLTPEQKAKAIRAGKLMGSGDPVTITKLTDRKGAMANWMSPADYTYDFGSSYKAWVYVWIYLAATIISAIFIHPLVAIPFAWKVGHNWGQYMGGLVFGKEDMKGKTMYATT